MKLSQPTQGVCLVRLNDPTRRNAMGGEMASAFRSTIDRLRVRDDLRVVILSGAGTAFSAGGDLKMLRKKQSQDPARNYEDMLQFYYDFLCVLDLEVPVIAAVNGHAIGAGACLALACDYRIAVENAKLGFTFTRLGLHPGMGATLTLPRVAGVAVASDLLMSGRIIDAAEALRLGLVNRVVTADNLVTVAVEYARALQSCGPSAVKGLLQTLRPEQEALQVALDREASEQAKNYASPEFVEGITAAIEQRTPRFDLD